MKFFLLFGGFVGFVLSYTASWNAGNAAAQVLRDGVIGCLAGATLFRGLHAMLMITLRSHVTQRIARERIAATEAGTAASTN
ncbi:MAG: hypothetical protein WCF18_24650 [Chthoniobacteraceae bacterium]